MTKDSVHKEQSGNFQTFFLRWMLRYPLVVIFLSVTITIIFGFGITKINFRTSMYDLIVESLPETARYNAFKEVFGSDEIIRVVIKTDGIFKSQNFSMVEKLSDAVEVIPGVRRLISLPAIKKRIEMSRKWELQRYQEVIQPVELFKKNLISEDWNTTILTAVLSNDADKERVIDAIQELIDNVETPFEIYQIGMPLVSRAMAQYTENDFKHLPPLTLFLVAIILWVIFRKISITLIVLGTVVSALIWAIGLMGWLRIPLSMMTMVMPVFLIAVGTAYCMHIISAYLDCRQKTDSAFQAVQESYKRIVLPTILTVLTTAIGLTSLLVNRIPAIHEFALLSCCSILILLVLLLTVFPAALVLIPQPVLRTGRQDNHPTRFDYLLEFIVRLNRKHRKTVLMTLGCLLLLGIVGMLTIRVETNPVGFFKDQTPISRHFHDIYQDLSGSFPINVVIDGGKDYFFEDPQNISLILKLQNYLETLPGVDKTVSFANYIQLVNYANNQYKPEYYRAPEEGFELRMLVNSYKTMLGDDMLTRFMNPSFSKTNILLLTHVSSSRQFLAIKDEILKHVKTNFSNVPAWDVTGFGMVVATSSYHLTWGQAKSFGLTMIFIFVIMLILFLSTKVGLIAIIPNIFPIIITFGIMGWFGIHLSMVTSLIASIAIGLAVDDTIHYLFRYNREFKIDLDKDRSMADSIRYVGKPVLITTITIGLGFAVLLFSSFKPTAVFGLLMVITMLSAVIGDLIILPSLMLNVELVTAWDLLKLMPTLSGISNAAAHELNQPLNVIKMGSDYLNMIAQNDEIIDTNKVDRVAQEIGTQVDRASDIIRRLTEFGNKPGFNKEPTDVNNSIQEALVLAENQLQLEDINIDLELAHDLPYIKAHPRKISEVVFNLLINACDAITVKKTISRQFRNESRITIRTSVLDQQIRICVSDNGIGIPAHLLKRITEPFFTTKTAGSGKGLGLSISKEIVKSYGGRIDVKSEESRQTEIIITFPSQAVSAPHAADPQTLER